MGALKTVPVSDVLIGDRSSSWANSVSICCDIVNFVKQFMNFVQLAWTQAKLLIHFRNFLVAFRQTYPRKFFESLGFRLNKSSIVLFFRGVNCTPTQNFSTDFCYSDAFDFPSIFYHFLKRSFLPVLPYFINNV